LFERKGCKERKSVYTTVLGGGAQSLTVGPEEGEVEKMKEGKAI